MIVDDGGLLMVLYHYCSTMIVGEWFGSWLMLAAFGSSADVGLYSIILISD